MAAAMIVALDKSAQGIDDFDSHLVIAFFVCYADHSWGPGLARSERLVCLLYLWRCPGVDRPWRGSGRLFKMTQDISYDFPQWRIKISNLCEMFFYLSLGIISWLYPSWVVSIDRLWCWSTANQPTSMIGYMPLIVGYCFSGTLNQPLSIYLW